MSKVELLLLGSEGCEVIPEGTRDGLLSATDPRWLVSNRGSSMKINGANTMLS